MVSGNASELVGVVGTGDHDGFVLKPVDQQLLFGMLGRQLGLIWIYEGSAPDVAPAPALPDAAREFDDIAQALLKSKIRIRVEPLQVTYRDGSVLTGVR